MTDLLFVLIGFGAIVLAAFLVPEYPIDHDKEYEDNYYGD